ncbi:unnamed protein product, partial [Musa hybrid cultivar]
FDPAGRRWSTKRAFEWLTKRPSSSSRPFPERRTNQRTHQVTIKPFSLTRCQNPDRGRV